MICDACEKAKSHLLPFVRDEKRSSSILDIVHCDLWGPAPVNSESGFRYYVIFVDDYSGFTWLYPLRQKSDFYDVLLQFKIFVENQLSSHIKTVHSDGGTEFTNKKS